MQPFLRKYRDTAKKIKTKRINILQLKISTVLQIWQTFIVLEHTVKNAKELSCNIYGNYLPILLKYAIMVRKGPLNVAGVILLRPKEESLKS